MKKKLLAILMCGVIILGLTTGCGNKKESNSPTGENAGSSQSENKEGVDVTNVYATSNKYSVVVADEKTYIIDNDGKKTGTIDFNISKDAVISINNNGYVYYTAPNEKNKILDKTGKVIYEKSKNENYIYITDNNYTKRTTIKSDFESGSSSEIEIIDMSGKVIKKIEDKSSYDYIGGNIWYGCSSYGSYSCFLYNEKTGNKVEIDADSYGSIKNSSTMSKKGIGYTLKDGGAFLGNQYVTADLKVMGTNPIYVNDEYYYNKEDYSIYKYDGTKEKEFTSGNGFSFIFSANNKYYVKSGTGYFYILDKSFNQEDEPYKLDEIKGNTRKVGNNCILNKESVKFNEKGYEGTWDHFYLYDYKGQLIEDFGEGFNGTTEISNNIVQIDRMSSTDYNERTGGRDTTYLGPQKSNKYINLSTGKVLKVY